MKVINPPLISSIGNHTPDNNDCDEIITDATPPTDLSLQIEPNNIPIAIKNNDVITLNNIAGSIVIENNDGSIIPPTKKNNIACIKANGNTANA